MRTFVQNRLNYNILQFQPFSLGTNFLSFRAGSFANNIKYVNILHYYTFNAKKIWVKREREQKHYAIGRLNIVSPTDSERFSLKLILGRVKGANCFKDLRTYEKM